MERRNYGFVVVMKASGDAHFIGVNEPRVTCQSAAGGISDIRLRADVPEPLTCISDFDPQEFLVFADACEEKGLSGPILDMLKRLGGGGAEAPPEPPYAEFARQAFPDDRVAQVSCGAIQRVGASKASRRMAHYRRLIQDWRETNP